MRRDEITGKVIATRTTTLMDVTSTRISARYTETGAVLRGGKLAYDRSWNVVEFPPWRYSPHDGLGLQFPLSVGQTWSTQVEAVSGTTGAVEKITAASKVTGAEAVTTRAGTFETYRIETTKIDRPLRDPTRPKESTIRSWYAPTIDRWVKRTIVTRINGLVARNETIELIEHQRAR